MSKGRRNTVIVIVMMGVLEAIFLLLLLPSAAPHGVFFIVSCASAGVWLMFMLFLEGARPRGMAVPMLVGAIVMRLSLISVEPLASDDVYRYIWDGKVQSQGIGPFAHAPLDDEVRHLWSEDLPAKINFPEMRTVYPALAQLVFLASYVFGGESILAFKVPLFLAEIASIALLLILLRRLGQPDYRIAWYALNPLAILQFMVDAHVDALAFPLILMFLLLWIERRRATSLLALGMSAAVKLFSLMFLPLLLRDAGKRWWLLGIAPGIVILSYIPYLLTPGHPFESLSTYSMNWTFNGSIFKLLDLLLQHNQLSRLLLTIATLGMLFLIGYQRRSIIWKVSLGIFAYLLLTPTVHPWYLTWLALLLPLYPRWSLAVFVAFAAVANYSGVMYQQGAAWDEPLWMSLALYLPVIGIFILESANGMPVPKDISMESLD